jgi:phage FluMu protein Com
MRTMVEVKVTLEFACCTCEHSVSVTVKCTGKGLTAGARTVAAVNVPCPHCGAVNQLYFEPTGTVRAVAPYSGPRPRPEPSLN